MDSKKVLVSIILLSYNNESYIKDSLLSLLEQSYDNYEIIIGEDASNDLSKKVIEDTLDEYRKDINIKIIAHPRNVGLVRNFNICLNNCNGDIIVASAGDDISFPHRVKDSVNFFDTNPNVSALSFNDYSIIDGIKVDKKRLPLDSDKIINFDEFFNNDLTLFSAASRAFRREVFDIFSELNPSCPTEDTPYINRCLFIGDIAILNKPGIYYRRHSNNLSSANSLKKMDFDSIFKQYNIDLKLAYNKKIINQVDILLVEKWIGYKTLKRAYQLSNKPQKFFILIRMFSQYKIFRKMFFNKMRISPRKNHGR